MPKKSKNTLASLVRRTLAVLFVLAAVGAVVIAWLPKPVPVDLAEVKRGPLAVSVDEDGRTRVKDRYVISAPLMGNVSRLELDPGDAVEPGTVVARLLPLSPALLDARQKAQAEAQVAAAQAARRQSQITIERVQTALEFAEREAARSRKLLGQGAASPRTLEQAELEERSRREELASAEFAAKVADHELRMAQAALGRMGKGAAEGEHIELSSPVKGVVLKVFQQSEGVVQPGAPLCEIGDPAALEVVVDVLTADAVHIQPGTPVSIERWGGQGALAAHVRLVEPSAFTRLSALGVEEQRVNVIIDLDEPRERWTALGDGYRVEARIIVWQGDDVLSVPSSAVFRRGQSWAAFAAADGKAHLVEVELGHENSHQVEIEKGLEVGAKVIVHPGEQVSDGVAIDVR